MQQHHLCKSHWKRSIYGLSLQSKLNVKNSSRRLKPDSCQKHQDKTDRKTANFRQCIVRPISPQAPPYPRLHFLLPESPLSEHNFNFFRTARTARPYTLAWWTLAIILWVCTFPYKQTNKQKTNWSSAKSTLIRPKNSKVNVYISYSD
jgi:hypothetical protein